MKLKNNFEKDIIALRREIHKNPELGNCEFKTAQLIEETLKKLKIPSKRVSKTGVVATIKGGGSNARTIALRADMDALAINEISNKPYKSKNSGVMHACGHDAHTAIVLGAAMLVRSRKLNGNVKLIFQPNEENSSGAKNLIAAKVLENPKVNAIVGVHVCPWLKTGTVGLKYGAMMAGVDQFKIEITGMLGHGAYPQKTIDSITAAAALISDLQTIVSRRVSPVDSVVVSIGKISGGTSYNIIAGKVYLEGTVRTLNQETRNAVKDLFENKLKGLELSTGVKCRLDYQSVGYPLINTSEIVDLCKISAAKTYGAKNIIMFEKPSMGGEDFSDYLNKVPGNFVYVGSAKNSATSHFWHHESFDIDESAMIKASEFLYNTAKEFLG
jgi:amidohydrolase